MHMKAIVRPRWFSRSAWWAMVTVTPEESSSAVLIVGSQNGVIVVALLGVALFVGALVLLVNWVAH